MRQSLNLLCLSKIKTWYHKGENMWYVNKNYYKDVINDFLWICPKTLKWWWYTKDIGQLKINLPRLYDNRQKIQQVGGPSNPFIGAPRFIHGQDERIVIQTTDLLYRIDKYIKSIGSRSLSEDYIKRKKIFKTATEQGRQGWKIDFSLLRSGYNNIKGISTELSYESQTAVSRLKWLIAILLTIMVTLINVLSKK